MDPFGSVWIPVGPAPEDATGFGVSGGVSGRVWTIAISPNYDGFGTPAMYIGIAGGGVWRSTDFTQALPRWTPLTDSWPSAIPIARQRGLQNIGALAVDGNRPRTIYAGSGDPAGPGDNAYGNGILKSTDGGNTWTLLSLTNRPFAPGYSRIFVDPTDATGGTVYATGALGLKSAGRGIYKTVDGGTTWTLVQSGMPNNLWVSDLDYTVSANRITLYAGGYDPSGVNGGIWISTDGAASWSPIPFISLLDLSSGAPVPQANIGLVKLAADHSLGAPHGVFAAVSNGPTGRLMNVFRLGNGSFQPSGNGLPAINTSSAQSIGISPEGTVYVGGVNQATQKGLYQSTNGGSSWVLIDVGVNGLRPHTDQRAWAFFNGVVYNGNDGGIYRFDPLPGGKAGPGTWESLNTPSLQTILAQGVGTHPRYPNVMVEGSQDNGLALRRGGIWTYVNGGDAAAGRFDPHDERYVFRTGPSDPSFFFRSDDGGITWPNDISVTGNPAITNYPPFAFHPVQSGRMAVGLDRVYETKNRGDDKWKAISGTLAAGNLVNVLAYADGNVLYVSYGDRIFKTVNGGGDSSNGNWSELNASNDWHGSITAIAVDPRNNKRVYLTSDEGAIWKSADSGGSWQEITSDFPFVSLTINALDLRSDSETAEPFLFVATNVGVWVGVSQAGNFHWQRLGAKLPDVAATDLIYNNTNKNLVVATYGRGLFATYLHYLTGMAPACTALRNVVFHFASDLDGRICVNQAEFGHAFSGWFEIQGNGRTDASPSATSVLNSVFVFVKGLDGRIAVNQAEFGHPFSGWFPVQGNRLTDAAPAATSVHNSVFVFIKGLDGRIYLNQAEFGHAFSGWFEVQGNGLTDVAPAAASVGNVVFVFMKGLDGRIYVNQAEFGHAFGGWFEVQGNGLTNTALGAASLNHSVFIFARGVDDRIFVNQAEFGHAFSGWFEVQGGGRTDAAPCATGIGPSLFVFVKGTDGRLYLNQAEFGHAFSGWFEVGGGIA